MLDASFQIPAGSIDLGDTCEALLFGDTYVAAKHLKVRCRRVSTFFFIGWGVEIRKVEFL